MREQEVGWRNARGACSAHVRKHVAHDVILEIVGADNMTLDRFLAAPDINPYFR